MSAQGRARYSYIAPLTLATCPPPLPERFATLLTGVPLRKSYVPIRHRSNRARAWRNGKGRLWREAFTDKQTDKAGHDWLTAGLSEPHQHNPWSQPHGPSAETWGSQWLGSARSTKVHEIFFWVFCESCDQYRQDRPARHGPL